MSFIVGGFVFNFEFNFLISLVCVLIILFFE